MHKLYSGLLLAGLLATLGACKKDDAKPANNLTAKEQLLTSHKWKISAIAGTTTTPAGTITTDGYAQLQTCKKDDFTEFKSDKTGVTDEGATRCSTSAPQNTPFTWSFNAAETELTVSGTTNGAPTTVTAEVLQITSSSMQIRTTNVQTLSGYTITSTATTTYIPY